MNSTVYNNNNNNSFILEREFILCCVDAVCVLCDSLCLFYSNYGTVTLFYTDSPPCSTRFCCFILIVHILWNNHQPALFFGLNSLGQFCHSWRLVLSSCQACRPFVTFRRPSRGPVSFIFWPVVADCSLYLLLFRWSVSLDASVAQLPEVCWNDWHSNS